MADLDKIGGLPVSGILIYQRIPTISSHQLRQKAYFRYSIDC